MQSNVSSAARNAALFGLAQRSTAFQASRSSGKEQLVKIRLAASIGVHQFDHHVRRGAADELAPLFAIDAVGHARPVGRDEAAHRNGQRSADQVGMDFVVERFAVVHPRTEHARRQRTEFLRESARAPRFRAPRGVHTAQFAHQPENVKTRNCLCAGAKRWKCVRAGAGQVLE